MVHCYPDINFELYVSRIASNICVDFLRAKSPARTRLKYRLRDLLKRHKDLVSWEYEGEVLCGFARWRDTGKGVFSDQSNEDIETKLESFKSLYFPNKDIRLVPLSELVTELFDWILAPLEIDVLVRTRHSTQFLKCLCVHEQYDCGQDGYHEFHQYPIMPEQAPRCAQ